MDPSILLAYISKKNNRQRIAKHHLEVLFWRTGLEVSPFLRLHVKKLILPVIEIGNVTLLILPIIDDCATLRGLVSQGLSLLLRLGTGCPRCRTSKAADLLAYA